MRKSTKIVRKLLALFLVVLMSIESFGALVSDNDGSAFITKGEFDSLKSSFQSQIDNYNTSIDSKIDGAIAGYLAGVNLLKWEKNNIINSDWDEVSCFSGTILPTYELPSFVGAWVYNSFYYEYPEATRREDWKNFSIIITSQYNGSNNYMVRPLCKGNVEGATSYTDDIVWDGITNYWTEGWDLTSISKRSNNVYALNDPANFGFSAEVKNLHDLRYSGYVPNLNYLSNYNKAKFIYTAKEYSTGKNNPSEYSITDGNYVAKMTTSIRIYESTSNIRQYKHIIQYDANTAWTLSNPSFLNTFRISDKQTKTSKSLNDNTNTVKNKNFSIAAFDLKDYMGSDVTGVTVPSLQTGQYWLYKLNDHNADLTITDDVSQKLPSIGMLPTDVKANRIKQWEQNSKWTIDKTEYSITPPSLEQGIPILRGKSGMKIKWDIKFKQGKAYNATTNKYVNFSDNPIIMLSLGPFTDKDQPTEVIETTIDSGITKQNYQIIPVMTKKTLEWTMENDGIVYAKWWNNATDPGSTNWIHTLDVANSSTFEYLAEN